MRTPILARRLAVCLFILFALVASLPSAFAASNARVHVDGKTLSVPPAAETVRAALAGVGVTLGPEDEVSPGLDTRLEADAAVRVTRVTYSEVTTDVGIPYQIVIQAARRGLRPYHPTVTREGRAGLKRLRYRVKIVDGREVERAPAGEEVIREPVDEIVTSRQPASLGSRGAYAGRRTMTMLTSAYDPGPGSCGRFADGKTCNGRRAGYGIIAVDPKVIPLGKKLFVPGYGYGISADVGGAIKGNRLDLGFNSRPGAMQWGKRWARIVILD